MNGFAFFRLLVGVNARMMYRNVLALREKSYLMVSVITLFVVGYWSTGLMSLLQGRFSGLTLSAETHTKPFPVGV